MKHRFLLDENVLFLPLRSADARAGQLWLDIARNCHMLVLSPELVAKMFKCLHDLRGAAGRYPIPTFETQVRRLLTVKEKQVWPEMHEIDSQDVQQDVRHEPDRPLAALAAAAPGCVFVTTDERTREDFNNSKHLKAKSVTAVTIAEAATLAKQRGL